MLFYGCINDEVLENVTEKHKHRYNTSYTTSDKAKILKPKIASFNQKHSNRDFEYENLTLKLDKILVLSDTLDNFKSYSILIEKIIPENITFHIDNLHVMEKDEVLLEDFITRWIPANSEEKIDLKTFTGVVQKYDIDYNLVLESTYNDGTLFNQSASYAMSCEIQTQCTCPGGPYCQCDGSYPKCVITVNIVCSLGGGGGSGSGDGSGSGSDGEGLGGDGGGGGSGGGSNNDGSEDENEDTLHPFVPIYEEYVENEPCVKLKDLFNPAKTNINPWINNIRPWLNQEGEKAVVFRKNNSGAYGGSYIPSTNENNINIPVDGDIYCAVHTHPFNTQPMFSWSDVLHLYNTQKRIATHNNGLATFLLLCKDDFGVEQLYAISINNVAEFNNKMESIIHSDEYDGCDLINIQNDYDDIIGEQFEKDNNYERQFLKMFQSYNITIAKANSQRTNWSILSVNTLSPSLIAETPCN